MVCARPHCENAENRIDGYCSIFCRDIHEGEQIEARSEALVAATEDFLEQTKDETDPLVKELRKRLQLAIDEYRAAT